MMQKSPSTPDEQVAQARAKIATWPPEKLASMQLQGFDPFHERRLRDVAMPTANAAAVRLTRASSPARIRPAPKAAVVATPTGLGQLAYERMQELSPPFGRPMGWHEISDWSRDCWTAVARDVAVAVANAIKGSTR